MFLVVNIVFILLIVRISLNGAFLNRVMAYRWPFLIRSQHAIFLIYFTVIAFVTANNLLNLPNMIYYVGGLLIYNLGVYYIVYHFLVPRYYVVNRYPLFILNAVLVFLISALFRILLESSLFKISENTDSTFPNYLYHIYSLQALVVVVASFFGITKDKFLIEQNYKTLGAEKEQLHFDLLKAKLSPHFLLNTLNNIYVKSLGANGETSASILQLSSLLQYVIYDSSLDKIPLRSEFSSMESLTGVYRLKYNRELNICFDLNQSDIVDNMEVPPALLLTLFENALKHSGIGSEEGSFIYVSCQLDQSQLLFVIRNSIGKRVVGMETGYMGLGNEAIKHLLERYYKGRFSLILQAQADDSFYTSLTIDLR
ncbi:putative signal transduction histidine kinase [Sphingobacterium deserti]|uniref:Putative signal transduction histidine kinase n=1 Tax=Sphingobacterium deserti TaxID=1229276 RepID=A0A0B8T5L8_9SPHI|nr:putative signal transduction histidine kinase [Sphingobacterium deserti]